MAGSRGRKYGSHGWNETELTELPECDVLGQLCILKMNGEISVYIQSFPKETQLFSLDFSWGPGSGSFNLGS